MPNDPAPVNKSSQAVFADPLLGSDGTATNGFMVHHDVEWLATVRGRLGYSWGPSLLYITGGGAWEKRNTDLLLSTDTAAGTLLYRWHIIGRAVMLAALGSLRTARLLLI